MFQGKVSDCIISTEKVEPAFENAASDHHEFQKHVYDWLQVADSYIEKKLSHSGDDKVDVISASKHNGDDDMCSGHHQHQGTTSSSDRQEASSSDRHEASTSDRHGENVYGGSQRYQGNASSTSWHGNDLGASDRHIDLDLSHQNHQSRTSRQELTLVKDQRSTDTNDVSPDRGQRSTGSSIWNMPFKKGQGLIQSTSNL